MAWLTAGWAMYSARAARVMLQSFSHTAKKILMWRSVKGSSSFHHNEMLIRTIILYYFTYLSARHMVEVKE